MKKRLAQRGFSLVTAIFLLVVVAVLMANMVKLNVNQQVGIAMDLRGARALMAARSALDVGIVKAFEDSDCAYTDRVVTFAGNAALSGFQVALSCSSSAYDVLDGVTDKTITIYSLVAQAEAGAYMAGSVANPDYVSRIMRVEVQKPDYN